MPRSDQYSVRDAAMPCANKASGMTGFRLQWLQRIDAPCRVADEKILSLGPVQHGSDGDREHDDCDDGAFWAEQTSCQPDRAAILANHRCHATPVFNA